MGDELKATRNERDTQNVGRLGHLPGTELYHWPRAQREKALHDFCGLR